MHTVLPAALLIIVMAALVQLGFQLTNQFREVWI